MAFTGILGSDGAELGDVVLGAVGGLTLTPNAVSANFSVRQAFLLPIVAAAVVAGFTTQPATLAGSGAATLLPNAVSANFAVAPATLELPDVQFLVANAVSANFSIQSPNLALVTNLSVSVVGANFAVMPVTLIADALPCSRAQGPITVGCILDNLFRQVGLRPSEYDVSAATDEVVGFIVAERAPVRDIVDPLLRVFQTDLIEVDGKIVAKKRGGAVVATITEEDLGARMGSGTTSEPRVKATIKQDLELPAEADITFFAQEKDYEQAQERDVRYTLTDIDEKLTLQTPIVMPPTFARQTITRILYQMWVERETFVFALTPKWLYLVAGDEVNIPVAGGTARVRIIAIDVGLFGPISVEAVLDEISILTQTVTSSDIFDRGDETGISEETDARVWSSNALRDVDAVSIGFYAVANGATLGADWLGCVLYMSRDGGSTYQPIADLSDPGTFGVTTSTLAAPNPETTGQFDRVNFVDITLEAGSPPVSASEIEVINGANAAMIGDEMIQFVTVTPLGGDNYRLSNLLRGRRGTDAFWGSHTSSDRFILLENGGATIRVEVDEGLVGKTVSLKAVTVGQTVAAATPFNLTITGNEFKCYAGHGLSGSRDMAGDLTIDWFRRTRSGGQWKDFVDADQPEEVLNFEVEILNGMTVVRTITGLTTSQASYSAADQTTDFGSPQASVSVRVYQIGRYGRGYTLAGSV